MKIELNHDCGIKRAARIVIDRHNVKIKIRLPTPSDHDQSVWSLSLSPINALLRLIRKLYQLKLER